MSPETTALTVSDFFAGWDLYAPSVMAAIIVGATLGVLGVYVVLRRLVFLSAALGQAASLGVVLSLWLFGAELGNGDAVPIIGGVALSVAAALVIGRKTAGAFRDGLLGALFLLGAAGTVLVATRIPHEMHDIQALLAGEGVAVLPEDLRLVAWLGGFVLLLHVVGWRGFAAVSFDPLGALVRRVPVRLFEVLLALTLALGIAAGIRVLGPLPVFALSILPSLAAARLGRNIPESLAIAAVLGALAGVYGYVVAYLLELPVGASQTGMALVVALLVELALRAPTLGSPRLMPRSGPAGAGTARHAVIARGIGLGLVALAVLAFLRPVRMGLDAAFADGALGGAGWELVATAVGLALAVPALVLAWRTRERGVVLPGLALAVVALAVVGLGWSDAPGWVELARPMLIATALAGIAASCREVGHRLAAEAGPG